MKRLRQCAPHCLVDQKLGVFFTRDFACFDQITFLSWLETMHSYFRHWLLFYIGSLSQYVEWSDVDLLIFWRQRCCLQNVPKVKTENRSGNNVELCGTTDVAVRIEEFVPWGFSRKCLSLRNYEVKRTSLVRMLASGSLSNASVLNSGLFHM